MKTSTKALKTFLVTMTLLSLTVEVIILSGGPYWLTGILMWMPAAAAYTALLFSSETSEDLSLKGLLTHLNIRKCRIRYIILGILFPLIYLLLPYMLYWGMHPDNFTYKGASLSLLLKNCLPIMIIGIFPNILTAIGEEIGWRGFLLPALLERMSLVKSLLITGLIWACWHLPLLAFGHYMHGTPLWYKLPAFILVIVPAGIIAGYLTYKSRSIWPATFLHAAHNNFDQAVFGAITKGSDKLYYVSETGIFTIICAWIIAAILLYKRDS